MGTRWKVIYYTTEEGICPVKRYIDSCSNNNQAKIFSMINYMEQKGPNLPRPYADLLIDGIHELRIKLSGNQVRILYFFCYKEFIVLSHSFIKKENTVPQTEIKRALTAREDFLKRFTIKDMMELGGML